MNGDSLLAAAIRIAVECHENQRDKNGAPYVLHPLRMLQRAQAAGWPIEVRIVAVLHDVLEDCADRTPEQLRKEGFPPVVLDALDLVTKRPEEAGEVGYRRFVGRICAAEGAAGRIARRVKILDLEDNMDILRYDAWSDKLPKRLKRYFEAHRRVTEAIRAKDETPFAEPVT
ncbi:MAG: hypothetical protein SFU56_03895 [Capsulimonadales bacterium]|nr:hypothetical protein [Capsulimonadales bacterium]